MNPHQFPFFELPRNEQKNYEKLINKIERLEKSIRILENRINKIEKIDNNPIPDEPTDMYMI